MLDLGCGMGERSSRLCVQKEAWTGQKLAGQSLAQDPYARKACNLADSAGTHAGKAKAGKKGEDQ